MTKRWTWIILLLIALMAFGGCSDDDDPVTPNPTAAWDALTAAGKAYIGDADCPGVIKVADLGDINDYTVIDFRAAADFNAGHIPGAYNSTLQSLVSDLTTTIPTDETFLVVCYTGQSAGHAKIALEMLGYEDTKSLLWGMSSWNSSLSYKWTDKTGNALPTPETTNNNGDLVEHSFPSLSSYSASNVVTTRVAETLANGFKAVTWDGIKDNLDGYFIINYFGEPDYSGTGDAGVPGHIPGAYQFTPYTSLGFDEMLKNLPTDKTIVVYCWTGQHSSQITFYLNMLGYDAKSLAFGSNALFYDNLTLHKWSEAQAADNALESGFTADADFQTIAAAGADYINDEFDCPGVITADDDLALLVANGDYTVIDIRSLDDYNIGHIPGAYHSTLATLLTDLGTTIPTDESFLVTCYTGQNAGYAKFAMEMSGYGDVVSLKFGMCSWHTSLTGKWDAKTADLLTNPETTNNNGELSYQAYPSLTGETVTSRLDAIMTSLPGVLYDNIKDNLDDYFIINYFDEPDYSGTGGAGVPGHIPGAFQFSPNESLGIEQMLGYLPSDDTQILVYCWTGQHSAQVTAYLNMLGYDAVSLYYGSNNLFHSLLTGHKWTGTTNTFPLVATPPAN